MTEVLDRPAEGESPEPVTPPTAKDRTGRIPHQPGLDGVRAVALLTILCYHAGQTWVPAGVLSVDVFFVLSGYLITSLLLAEHDQEGGIGLKVFWTRRALRLLPALMVLLVLVALYAAFIGLPPEASVIRGDAIGSLFYVANWQFIYSGASYFQELGPPSPLRHMWSLAIEEQAYLVVPVVVAGLLAWRKGSRTVLLVVAITAGIVSAGLMIALYNPSEDPSPIYFGTHTRLQALLAGVILAIILERALGNRTHPPNRAARIAIEVMGWAGVGVLAWMITGFTDQDPFLFRGGFTLTAIAAAAMIAAVVAPGKLLLNSVLSLGILGWIGMISYGLYLYHWPIYMVFDEARTGMSGGSLFAVRVALTFIAGAVSFYLLERPIRRHGLRAFRQRLWFRPVIVLPIAAAVTLVVILVATAGAPTWEQYFRQVGLVQRDASVVDPDLPRVLLVGDSSAFSLSWSRETEANKGMFVYSATRVGCGIATGRPVSDGTPLPAFECPNTLGGWRTVMQQEDPDVVLVEIGPWEVVDAMVRGKRLRVGTPAHAAYLEHEIDNALGVFTEAGAKVVILDIPCFAQKEGESAQGERSDPRRRAAAQKVIDGIDAKRDDVSVLHWSEFLCPGGQSDASLRPDGQHFNERSGERVWAWMAPELRPLSKAARDARRESGERNESPSGV